jgi:hypothetical protein
VRVDVGINYDEVTDSAGDVTLSAKIMDIGDLSTFTSFEEIEANGKTMDAGKVGIEKLIAVDEIQALLC